MSIHDEPFGRYVGLKGKDRRRTDLQDILGDIVGYEVTGDGTEKNPYQIYFKVHYPTVNETTVPHQKDTALEKK